MSTFVLGSLFALVLLVATATLVALTATIIALRAYLRDTSVPDGRERVLTIGVIAVVLAVLFVGDVAILAVLIL